MEPAVRRRAITGAEIEKYGPTRGCPGCNAKVRGESSRRGHNEECRVRIEKLMREDADDRRKLEATDRRITEHIARKIEKEERKRKEKEEEKEAETMETEEQEAPQEEQEAKRRKQWKLELPAPLRARPAAKEENRKKSQQRMRRCRRQ